MRCDLRPLLALLLLVTAGAPGAGAQAPGVDQPVGVLIEVGNVTMSSPTLQSATVSVTLVYGAVTGLTERELVVTLAITRFPDGTTATLSPTRLVFDTAPIPPGTTSRETQYASVEVTLSEPPSGAVEITGCLAGSPTTRPSCSTGAFNPRGDGYDVDWRPARATRPNPPPAGIGLQRGTDSLPLSLVVLGLLAAAAVGYARTRR